MINFNLHTKFKPPKQVKTIEPEEETELTTEEISVFKDKPKHKTINKVLIGTIVVVIAVGIYIFGKKIINFI